MISIKSQKEIEIMREGGKILAGIMEKIAQEIAPGKIPGNWTSWPKSLFLLTAEHHPLRAMAEIPGGDFQRLFALP